MIEYNVSESIIVTKALSGAKLSKSERTIYKAWNKRQKRILNNWKAIRKEQERISKEPLPF